MAKSPGPLKRVTRDTAPRLLAGVVFVVLSIWLYPQLDTVSYLITLATIGATLGLLCWSSFNSQQTQQRELTRIRDTLVPILPNTVSVDSQTKSTSALSHLIQQQLQQLAMAQQSLGAGSSNMLDQARHAQQAAAQVVTELEQQQNERQSATAGLDTLRSIFGQLLDSADAALEISKKSEAEGDSGKLAMTEAMSGVTALGESVNETGGKVDTLGENSEAIGGIVNVIKSVAEQTNLLALNAAIEAARAGEQGRGFAVVADEVRSLANKTQDSAQEIEDLIQQLLRNVESANTSIHNSMQLAERSDELIEGMVVSYSEIVGHMTEIENLAQTMTNTAAQGQQGTNDIAQHLQQLESGLENSREQLNQFDAASHELIAQGEQLNQLH